MTHAIVRKSDGHVADVVGSIEGWTVPEGYVAVPAAGHSVAPGHYHDGRQFHARRPDYRLRVATGICVGLCLLILLVTYSWWYLTVVH